MKSHFTEGEPAPSVLVVDDNHANLQLLSSMLKRSGFKARPVPSGQLAIEASRSDPPDLILLDIDMPGMDGYEVCRRLKAGERLKDIPVIFISAHDETGEKVRAFEAGGVDYITKPFHFEEVAARVSTHLEIQRQKRELQESYGRLRELESLRDSLVHMIIHDLRSPLMGVGGCLQALALIEGERLSKKAGRLLQEATKTTDSLGEMVGTLLSVHKMESNALKPNLAACDVGDLMKGALARVEALKGDRRFILNLPDKPVGVQCDAELIQRVIQNLLSNAFQFTTDGSEVILGAKTGGGSVLVSVRDNGPGIPEDCHARVFEKFGQVAPGGKRHKHNTGLGLTFCKLAVEAHGGTIGLDSEVGKGSTFWFTLPGAVGGEKGTVNSEQ